MTGPEACHGPSVAARILMTQVTCAFNAQALFLPKGGSSLPCQQPRWALQSPPSPGTQCYVAHVPHRAPASSRVVGSPHG